MATCAGSPQIAIRAPGSNKCPRHHGKEIALYCKNCDKLICMDCVSNECEKHILGSISNIVPTAKEKLQEFITKVELTEIPRIKGEIQAAESDLTKNKNYFKTQIQNIRTQNEALKEKLDKITETFVKTCQGMEQQNSGEFLNYKKELQTRIGELSSQIQEFKGTLQSGSDILVFDKSQLIPSDFDDLPSTPVYITYEFTPGQFSLSELEQLLGKLNNTIKTHPFNVSGNWRVASELTPYTGHRVKSIHITSEDQAWFNFLNFNTGNAVEKMILTDRAGKIQQTLESDVKVFDFCLSPNTGNIWFCSRQDNSVREVKGGNSTIRFKTDTAPWCICVTKDDHVIIGQPTKVVKYTQGGQVVCRTSVVRSAYHLSECPLTSQIAAVNWDKRTDGGNGKAFISILNDKLQLLFVYTGNVQGQQPLTFIPVDVCYTSTGELVITDYKNKSVVLVTGTGRYLQSLYTHSDLEPYAVCVNKGAVWVSFWNKNVQVLRKN